MGHRPQDPWPLRRLAEAAAARSQDIGTRGLVQALDSLARLNFHPGADVLGVLLAETRQRMMLLRPPTALGAGATAMAADDGDDDAPAAASAAAFFGPPDTKGLATLVRALLRLSHHPGRDFLRTLEASLARAVARGARLAWAPMALAAFGHCVADSGLSSTAAAATTPPPPLLAFHNALSRGLMLRSAGANGGASAQQPPRRIATLTLSQLAAILWGLAATDAGRGQQQQQQRPLGRRLARRVMAEACLRLQGQGPKGAEGGEEEDGDGEPGVLECDLDALTVHARLRQAGAYFAQADGGPAAAAATEAEQLQRQLPTRFLRLVDGYRRQCLGGAVDGDGGMASSASAEGRALVAQVCARLSLRGWGCHIPSRVQQQEGEDGDGDGDGEGWLEAPDVVVFDPDDDEKRRPLALVALLPGQYFASAGFSVDDDEDDNDEDAEVDGWGRGGEGGAGVRPMGAAAFRLRCVKACWGARRVVAVTPDNMQGVEARLVSALRELGIDRE